MRRCLSAPAAGRSIRALCRAAWRPCAARSGLPTAPPRMRSGTALPPICWPAAAICGRSRNCSGMRACRPRSAIPRSRPSGSWPSTTTPIPAPGRGPLARAQAPAPGRKRSAFSLKPRIFSLKTERKVELGLSGKRAIVTGGSRGIGRAICELLAAEGCDLALCARGKAGLDAAVGALQNKGVRAYGGIVDVADTAALRAWVGEAAGLLGGLDVFIANVSALAQAMDEESWRRSLDIDMLGTVAGCEAAIPLLEQSAAGAIVVIGTTGAVEIAGAPRPYASVKAALLPYVKALARNLAPKGVRAN